MEEKPKGKGLLHFLRWQTAQDQDPKDHPGDRFKALAFVLFILILTCVLVVWTYDNCLIIIGSP